MAVKVAFSILAADFSQMGADIRAMERAGVDMFHLDVMDGHFVPNLTFGSGMVKALRRHSKLPFDVHLMVTNPEIYIEPMVEAGAGYITVHAEATFHLDRLLNSIRRAGIKAGIAINPATPVAMVEEALYAADLVLVMSVNPGFGGQSYIPGSADKLARLRQMIDDHGLSVELEVDGGIGPATAHLVKQAGVNIMVVGSALAQGGNTADIIKTLQA